MGDFGDIGGKPSRLFIRFLTVIDSFIQSSEKKGPICRPTNSGYNSPELN
jgi:hypothetical protein